jgi:hypothetical protein
VYRRGPGEPGFTLVATTPGTGPGTTTYQDLTVKPSSTYQYQVSAYDGANNESAPSVPLPVSTPAGPASKTYTFVSSGDATIDKASPASNAGASTTLTADKSPLNDFVVKFAVTTTGCTAVTGATLRLTDKANGSVKGGDVYSAGTGWSEGTVTYATAPAPGKLLASLGPVSSGGTYTLDVTTGVSTLDGEVAFRVGSTSDDGAHYYSREAGTSAQKPQLTVVCAGA